MLKQKGKPRQGESSGRVPGEICTNRQQVQIDSRPVPTRMVSDGTSRETPHLSHLLVRAGVAQWGPAELSSPDLWQPQSRSALLSCRSERMGEAWIGEAVGGRWERETGGEQARILGSDG